MPRATLPIGGVSRSDGRKISLCAQAGCAFIPALNEERGGTALAPSIDVAAFLRATIVLMLVSLMALHAAAQRPSTEVERDVRAFYEGASDRTVWVDSHGRPTADAQHAIARLRGVAEDGLDPPVYRADDLARQAAALEAGAALLGYRRGGVRCEPHIRGPDVLPPPAPRPGEPSRAWL